MSAVASRLAASTATAAPYQPRPPGAANNASAMNKSNMTSINNSAAAPMREPSSTASELAATTTPLDRVLQTGQPNFSTQLDFIKVNRAVAALERAVERLELLSLLDATGPAPAEAGQRPGGAGASGSPSTFGPQTSMRGPATLSGQELDPNSATNQKMAEVLAASQQQRGRGRASVLELLAEQRVLERRYGELLVQAQPTVSLHPGEPHLHPQCFSHVRDAAQVAVQRELGLISSRLRDTNRLLCTQLQDNPQDMDNWAKVCNERRELTALLRELVEELTTGYAESLQHRKERQLQQQQTGAGIDGGPRRSGVQNSTSEEGRHNGDASAANSNGASVSSYVRQGSRQSSVGGGGGGVASSESGSGAPTLRRFGSTVQRRRASRSQQQGPRIPLASSYQQFAVKILQEEASQRWADEVLAKERALNQNVKQLQADLVRERELKDREVAERLARVSTLQVELRKLKTALQQRTEAAKARGEAATENLQREGAAELKDVRLEVQRNEQMLAIGATTHETFSEYLRERTAAMDALAGEWDAKAMRELKKKEAAKIDAEGSRQACAQRLTDLEHERDTQVELKDERDTVQRAEDEERRRSEEQRSAEYFAASVLEAALKAMMTRQTISKLQKGSKKKKKAG